MSIVRLILGLALIVVAIIIFVNTSGTAWWALGGASFAGGAVLLISAFRTRS